MSHDTHHTPAPNSTPGTSVASAKWVIIILAGLFIGAVNFVSVMSHDDGGHGEGHGTEHTAPAAGHDAAPATHGEATPAEEHHEEAAADTEAGHTEGH